jgi:hypothetical protein
MIIQKSGDPSKTSLPLFAERGGGKKLLDRHQNLGKPSLISLFFPRRTNQANDK